jgi:hypothetical protein
MEDLNTILASVTQAIETRRAEATAFDAEAERNRIAAAAAWAEVHTLEDSASKLQDALYIAAHPEEFSGIATPTE